MISLRNEFETFRNSFHGREGVVNVQGMTCSSVSLALSAAASPGSQAIDALATSTNSAQSEAMVSRMLRSAADEVLADVRDEQHTLRCALESEHLLIRQEMEGLKADLRVQLAGAEESLDLGILNSDSSFKGRLEALEEAVLNLGRNLVNQADLQGSLETEQQQLQQRMEELGDAWRLADSNSSQRLSRLEEGLRATSSLVTQLQVVAQRPRVDELTPALRASSSQAANGFSPDLGGDCTVCSGISLSGHGGAHSRLRAAASARCLQDSVRAALSVNPRRQPSEASRMCRTFWAWAELLPRAGTAADLSASSQTGTATKHAPMLLEDTSLHTGDRADRYHPLTPSALPPATASRSFDAAAANVAWLEDGASTRPGETAARATSAAIPASMSSQLDALLQGKHAELEKSVRELREDMRELPSALRELREFRRTWQAAGGGDCRAAAQVGEAASSAARHLSARLETGLEKLSAQVGDVSAVLERLRLRVDGVEARFNTCFETTGIRVNALDDRIVALTEDRHQASSFLSHDEQPKLWAELECISEKLAAQQDVSAETTHAVQTLADDLGRWRCEASCRTASTPSKGRGIGPLSPLSEVLQEQREGAASVVSAELREMAAMATGTLRTTQELMRWSDADEAAAANENTEAGQGLHGKSLVTPTSSPRASPSRFPWGINHGLRSAAAASPEPGHFGVCTSRDFSGSGLPPTPGPSVAALREELECLAMGLSECREEQQQISASVTDEAKLALFEARQCKNQGIKAKAELEQVFADLDEHRLETSEWRASLPSARADADSEVKQELANVIEDARQQRARIAAIQENQQGLEAEVNRFAVDLDECFATATELSTLGSRVQEAVESLQEQHFGLGMWQEQHTQESQLAEKVRECSSQCEDQLARVAAECREQHGVAKDELTILALDVDKRYNMHEARMSACAAGHRADISEVAEQLSALESQTRAAVAGLEEEGKLGVQLRHLVSEMEEQAGEVHVMRAELQAAGRERHGDRDEVEKLMAEVHEFAAKASEGQQQMPARAEEEFDRVFAELSELRVEAGRTAGKLSTLGLQIHQVVDDSSKPAMPAPVMEELRVQQERTVLTEQRLQALATELLGPHHSGARQHGVDGRAVASQRERGLDLGSFDEGCGPPASSVRLSGAVEEWRAGVAELRNALCRTWEADDACRAHPVEAASLPLASAIEPRGDTTCSAAGSGLGGNAGSCIGSGTPGGFAAWVADVDVQGQRLAARVDVLTASQRTCSEEALALRSDLAKVTRDAERTGREAAHKAEAAAQELLGVKLKEVRDQMQKDLSKHVADVHARVGERSAALVADWASQRALCAKMGGDLEALQGHLAEVVDDSVEMRRQVLSLCEARNRRASRLEEQELISETALKRGGDESFREVRQECRETAERLGVLSEEVAAVLGAHESTSLGEVRSRCAEVANSMSFVQDEVDRLAAQVSAGEQNASRGLCLLQQAIEALQVDQTELRRAVFAGR